VRTRLTWALVFSLALPGLAGSQTTPVEGLRDNTPGVHALVNGRVVVAPGRVLEGATVVIRDGIIEAVGANVRPPGDAQVWDLEGRTLYAGFIDPYARVGMPGGAAQPARGAFGGGRGAPPPEPAPTEEVRGPMHWNPQVRANVDAADVFTPDDEASAALRAQGFGAAMVVPRQGMFRGQTAAVSLGSGAASHRVLRSGIAHSLTLQSDRSLGRGYPTSAMGVVALVRQTLYDVDWYGRAQAAYLGHPQGQERPETNASLAALGPALKGGIPLLFEVHSPDELFRTMGFCDEFSVTPWIRGSGYEYQILDVMGNLNAPLILPVAFPAAPSVDGPDAALDVSLAELRHWYLAPENPARLMDAGIEFALTTDGLRNPDQFLPNVREAVNRGLSADAALAAMTTTPARLLGLQQTYGALEAGKVANVVVVDGDLFADDAVIRDVWVDGQRFEVEPEPQVDARGRWALTVPGQGFQGDLTLSGTPARLNGTIAAHGTETDLRSAALNDETRELTLSFDAAPMEQDGIVRFWGTVAGDELFGWGELPDGSHINWRGERTGSAMAASDSGPSGQGSGARGNRSSRSRSQAAPALQLPPLRPAMAFGRERIPDQPENVLVRNATIWTEGPQGVLRNADLLVRRGTIVEVGQNLTAPSGAVVIDATGQHVTPGLVDPHVHSAIDGGTNETGGAIVPEVRIEDVLTMDDPWAYRQLAGGLTTAHILHGSANPIGGQNATMKMRWGSLPKDLIFQAAPVTIKFALGENVKRSEGRYPDTRMGTEEIIRDSFKAALDYRRAWEAWEETGEGIPPRKDLRMEALLDILDGKLPIHAHGYRADEILMLMKLADEFGLKIQVFIHAVEGYKVADDLREYGAAAMVWTDWGSFKVESYDATTYNAEILREAGVFTTLHSDDSQLSSRMNWEAGKLLKSGISAEDALAMVTLIPATVLEVQDRIGSLEAGKDADFVIWSGDPLSTSTIAQQTWVDGRRYFDIDEDREARQEVERERALLIQRVLEQR